MVGRSGLRSSVFSTEEPVSVRRPPSSLRRSSQKERRTRGTRKSFSVLVGVTGFEPTTSCSQKSEVGFRNCKRDHTTHVPLGAHNPPCSIYVPVCLGSVSLTGGPIGGPNRAGYTCSGSTTKPLPAPGTSAAANPATVPRSATASPSRSGMAVLIANRYVVRSPFKRLVCTWLCGLPPDDRALNRTPKQPKPELVPSQ